jgi:hypothetical protein
MELFVVILQIRLIWLGDSTVYQDEFADQRCITEQASFCKEQNM